MSSTSPNAIDGAAPDDGTTLTEVLAAYASGGFGGSFTAGEAATIECHACGVTSPARDYPMSSLRRLEGASDPDDMMSVVAVSCPACDNQGVLVLGFGPNATAEDSDITRALQDVRHESEIAGNSAPGEVSGDTPDGMATTPQTLLR
jgi:hypothetical protein